MFILRMSMHRDNKIGSICCYLSLLSTFSYAFPPRAESATFLFATMRFGPTLFLNNNREMYDQVRPTRHHRVRYASCDFLAKSYKAKYRTLTDRVSLRAICILYGIARTRFRRAFRLGYGVSFRRLVCIASRNWQRILQRIASLQAWMSREGSIVLSLQSE